MRLLIPWYGVPLQRGEDVRPFFIVGSGRSGTTLLRRMILASPGMHIPPETYVLGHVIRLFRRLRGLEWADLVRATLAQFEYRDTFDSFEVSLRKLAAELEVLPKKDRSLARVLDAFYRFHASETGTTCVRWGDKTPFNTYYLGEIHGTFPKAQFVHMLRDGVDVAASYVAAGIYDDVGLAGTRWKASVEAVWRFAQVHRSSTIEVRYEELVADPEGEIGKLCGFLDIPYEPGLIRSEDFAKNMGDVPELPHHEGVHRRISTDPIGKGRRSLSIRERERLAPIVNPTLKRAGYPECDQVDSSGR